MKSGILVLVILFALEGGKVFANGGPIDVSSSLGSGNVCLLQEEDVQLRSEHLTIVPVGDWVEVHAVYTLENTGAAKEVEYGFPVEIMMYDLSEYYDSPDKEPIVFILDGAMPLPIEVVTIPGSMDAAGMDRYTVDGIVEWHTTSLSFEAGEIKVISVHSSVLASYEDFATSKGFLPSYSSRYFRYTLDPAGYWGCGTADEMQAAIDFSWVVNHGGEVDEISGPGEWLTDNVYGFSSEDFLLDGAGFIEFQFSISEWHIAQLIEDSALRSWELQDYNVSSVLPEQDGHEYDARKLFDGDVSTAWVESDPGNGVGEWIEVDLPDTFGLGIIAIVNGYQSSREAYESNGKAASVRCTVHFTDGSTETTTVDLDDLSWDEVSSDPTHGYQVIYDSGIAFEISKFRLEILSVYPGSIYSDMCISECIVLGNPGGIWVW